MTTTVREVVKGKPPVLTVVPWLAEYQQAVAVGEGGPVEDTISRSKSDFHGDMI